MQFFIHYIRSLYWRYFSTIHDVHWCVKNKNVLRILYMKENYDEENTLRQAQIKSALYKTWIETNYYPVMCYSYLSLFLMWIETIKYCSIEILSDLN